jgi:hypothetical protein
MALPRGGPAKQGLDARMTVGHKTGIHDVVRQFLDVIDFFVVGRCDWAIIIRPLGLNGLLRVSIYPDDFGI